MRHNQQSVDVAAPSRQVFAPDSEILRHSNVNVLRDELSADCIQTVAFVSFVTTLLFAGRCSAVGAREVYLRSSKFRCLSCGQNRSPLSSISHKQQSFHDTPIVIDDFARVFPNFLKSFFPKFFFFLFCGADVFHLHWMQ